MLKKQKRKTLLFVDNYSSHLELGELNNIKLKYLSLNITSKAQPMDQGIIHSFKANYKTYFLKKITALIRSHIEEDINHQNLSELQKTIRETINGINIKDSINWTVSAWNDVSQQTLENYFKKSGFQSSTDLTDNEFNEESNELFE